MGTAVIPLAISFQTGPWVRPTAAVFIIISVVMFIAIAPMAIITVAFFKMMHLFESGTSLDIDAHGVEAVSVLRILAAWGFAAWSFVMALVIVIAYLRHLDLPYALSWWAYTFPLGSLAVATGVAGKVFESPH